MFMIKALINVLFECRHRHTTFPLTPAGKTKNQPGETYVVCLDCCKQFRYDWEHMSMGKGVDLSANSNSADLEGPNIPVGERSRLRYVAWASVIPAAWLILKAGKSLKRRGKEDESRTFLQSKGNT